MPIHRYGIKARHQHDDLVARLAMELSDEGTLLPGEAKQDLPDIYIEEFGSDPNDAAHVYVVWSKWEDVPEAQRSAVILDALKKAKTGLAPRVAIAMGVTPEEAELLGIEPAE